MRQAGIRVLHHSLDVRRATHHRALELEEVAICAEGEVEQRQLAERERDRVPGPGGTEDRRDEEARGEERLKGKRKFIRKAQLWLLHTT